MSQFVEVTHKRTNKLTRVNMNHVVRIDKYEDDVVFTLVGGDILPVENTWQDIADQMAK